MTCRTFTHHVDGAIRVECTVHPRWIVDAEKTGDLSARQVASAAQASHEAGEDQ